MKLRLRFLPRLVWRAARWIALPHRIYGQKVGDQMSKWLNDNGPKMEKMLMGWNNIPSPASLRELPRTADGSS